MKKLNQTARYALSALALAAAAAGCQSSAKQAGVPNNPSVTDIAPVPPAQPQQMPEQVMPMAANYSQQPVATMAMATTYAPAPSYGASGGGNTYTVQKGDTLFKIAREHYGDAAAWKKIAAANPGAGNIIKPGQKLILP